jgi:hypothetical protein
MLVMPDRHSLISRAHSLLSGNFWVRRLPVRLLGPVIACISELELKNFNGLVLISFFLARARARGGTA